MREAAANLLEVAGAERSDKATQTLRLSDRSRLSLEQQPSAPGTMHLLPSLSCSCADPSVFQCPAVIVVYLSSTRQSAASVYLSNHPIALLQIQQGEYQPARSMARVISTNLCCGIKSFGFLDYDRNSSTQVLAGFEGHATPSHGPLANFSRVPRCCEDELSTNAPRLEGDPHPKLQRVSL